jgi:serine/threonine-protein kinase
LRQFRVPAALGLFALVAAAGLLGLYSSGWKKTGPALTAAAPIPRIPPGPPRTADPHSVAVLPFENRSADPTDEYLSDGLTEELLNALARVRGLRVPGRASSFAFKGRTGHDIYHQIGNQLHVATALGGSVSKAGDKLRVTAQLINVDDGFVLWATNYYGDMQDLFTFQTQVAERVVRALSVKLGVEESRELETPPTANPEAHRQYLLGRALFNKGSISNFTASMPYFQRAIQLDPHFALAYCGLADAYGFTSGILMPGRQGWAKEQELARQALALDPKLAEAHFSLGLALASAFQWAEGETEIKRAIEMNPNLAVAYDQYAFLLTCLGRHDEAIAMSRHAVALDPISPLMNIDLGWWLLFARRYDAAVAQCHQALALDPQVSLGHWALGWSLLWSGDKNDAMMEFEQARKLDPQPFFEAPLGYACAVTGHRAQAEQILQALASSARTNYASPGLQAYPSLGLGETEKIYGCLNQSLEEQDYPVQFLKVDPAFDPLRGDPRFQALLKKAGLNP